MPAIGPVRIKNPDGTSWTGCTCWQAIWPSLCAVLKKRGVIKSNPDVMQGSYNRGVSASAKTHWGGGVIDVAQRGGLFDDICELAGIACYERDWRDNMPPHSHMILIGCPHLHWQARAQVASWKIRRNGLVSNLFDRDQTRPSARTWRGGLSWLNNQLGPAKPVTPTKPSGGQWVSIAALKAARYADPPKKGTPKGPHAAQVKILEEALKRTRWLKSGAVDGHYGSSTVKAVQGFQRKHSRTRRPDGWMGRKELQRLFALAGMRVEIRD